MTSTEHLGWKEDGEKIPLYLSRGDADFIHVLNAPASAPFPSGLTGYIKLYLTQAAAVTAPNAPLATWTPLSSTTTAITWKVQSDAADGPIAMIAAGAGWYRLYVAFPAVPSDDYLWYYGAVKYRG